MLSSLMVSPFRRSPPATNQNECGALACGLDVKANNHTDTVLPISEQSRTNGQSSSSFSARRRAAYASAVSFFSVNLVNFFQESFPLNLIFVPLLTILLSFLQIGSSGPTPSPHELRPAAFRVSLACSVAYYLTLAAKFMFPGFASLFGILASIFGSLAVATLISLTLQLPWWSILFILTFMVAFFKLINILHRAYGNISRPQPTTIA